MDAITLKVNNGFVKAKGWMFPFILLTSLFFFWTFVHNLDPVLVQRLRRDLRLYNLQRVFHFKIKGSKRCFN